MEASEKGYYLGSFRRAIAAMTGILIRSSLMAECDRKRVEKKSTGRCVLTMVAESRIHRNA